MTLSGGEGEEGSELNNTKSRDGQAKQIPDDAGQCAKTAANPTSERKASKREKETPRKGWGKMTKLPEKAQFGTAQSPSPIGSGRRKRLWGRGLMKGERYRGYKVDLAGKHRDWHSRNR